MRTSCSVTLVLGALALFVLAPAGAASVPRRQAAQDASLLFRTGGGVRANDLANARTIPHWTFQYTDPTNGVTYPITMAGGDPRSGDATTTIHTVIVPLRMNFVAGNQRTSVLDDAGYVGFRAHALDHTFDATTRAQDVLDSPIFSEGFTTPADMGGDTAQVGDAFLRAQWGKLGTGYHVRLVNDSVLPTQTIDLPESKGLAYQRPVGAWREAHGYGTTDTITGVADYYWFSARLQNLLGSLHISPTTIPIFLTDNVVLYEHGTYLDCCVLGFHGAAKVPGHGPGSTNGRGNNPVQTYVYAAWSTPGSFSGFITDYTGSRTQPSPTRGVADIHNVSHELSELLDDPFANNVVQPWQAASAPQYGCSDLLETGDPVVGVWFPYDGNPAQAPVGTTYYGQYHPEDEAFAQWFGRGGVEPVMGPSWDGRLTFMGPRTIAIGGPWAAFGTYAHGCS